MNIYEVFEVAQNIRDFWALWRLAIMLFRKSSRLRMYDIFIGVYQYIRLYARFF